MSGRFNIGSNSSWLILGEAILLASIQVSLASVELSSKYSVLNFSKDQETLQNAANALYSYVVIGIIFTIGSVLTLSSIYGKRGFLMSVIANFGIIGWIVGSYCLAFKRASERYGLEMPKLFSTIV